MGRKVMEYISVNKEKTMRGIIQLWKDNLEEVDLEKKVRGRKSVRERNSARKKIVRWKVIRERKQ